MKFYFLSSTDSRDVIKHWLGESRKKINVPNKIPNYEKLFKGTFNEQLIIPNVLKKNMEIKEQINKQLSQITTLV